MYFLTTTCSGPPPPPPTPLYFLTSPLLAIVEFDFRRIWRTVLQIKEGFITGLQTGFFISYEIALLFVSPFSKELWHFPMFFCSPKINDTTSSPGFRGQRFINLQQAALLTQFWRHRFNNLQRAAIICSRTFDVIGSMWQSSFQI